MPPKSNDKMRELRERAAAMINRPPTTLVPDATRPDDPPPVPELGSAAPTLGLSTHFGMTALDQVVDGRTVQRIPLTAIAPEVREEGRQPRFLPLPDELLIQGRPNPDYADLIATLYDLGRSIKERQIQPIVVYPGVSEVAPTVRYIILVGHRRWTAAHLVGITEIDAVIVDPPSPSDRVRVQYAENEDRADFSDMERVWALQQMKQALDDAPWEAVETRFQLSRGRRQELLRLASFTAEQQTQIARLRLRETQLRPLHAAVRAGELPPAHVDAVLSQLGRLSTPTKGATGETRPLLDGPTIARVVAQAKRNAHTPPQRPTPQWVTAIQQQLDRTDRQVTRTRARLSELSETDAAKLRAHLESTARRIQEIVQQLAREPAD